MDRISKLVGKTVSAVDVNQGNLEDHIKFTFTDGSFARFYHDQDCCEDVDIEDINGDWNDLIGQRLLVAEERTKEAEGESDEYLIEHETWTFYTFRSIKGSVDVRWYGKSNGWYSERVNLEISEDA